MLFTLSHRKEDPGRRHRLNVSIFHITQVVIALMSPTPINCQPLYLQQNGEFLESNAGVVDVLTGPFYSYNTYVSYFDRFTCYGCTPGPYPGYIHDSTGAIALLNDLKLPGTQNFYFYGHGYAAHINDGISEDDGLNVIQVADALGNNAHVNDEFANNSPYRFVFLDSCTTRVYTSLATCVRNTRRASFRIWGRK